MQIELLSSKFAALDREYLPEAQRLLERAANGMNYPFSGLRFARIAAERDVVEEADSDTLELKQDGTGATSIIQRVISDEKLPSELVEQTLLDDLNKIMGPDASFSRIAAQRTGTGTWVIHLDEREKGRISPCGLRQRAQDNPPGSHQHARPSQA